MDDSILPGKEPIARKFIGWFVAFDLRRAGGTVTREKGEVIAQEWLGFTKRGAIPEYRLTIRGGSGRSVFARLTDDYVQPL